MTEEELEKKAEEYAEIEKSLPYIHGYNLFDGDDLVKAYIAGAKEMLKENDAYWQNIITEQHKLVDECRIKTEEENEQLKQQIEKMKCCGNCTHRNAEEVIETCKKKKIYTLHKGFCDKWGLAE